MSVAAMMANPSMIYAPSAPGISGGAAGAGASPASIERFESFLSEGINKVNNEQIAANGQVEEMVSSQGANLHEAMIALSRAEITLRLGVKVGQKLVNAYQELQRIQI
jgi:flagellar hook-basal body complex protein FliE